MSLIENSSTQSGPMAFKLRKVVDPRTDVEDISQLDNEYLGYVGAQYWNRYSIPATSYSGTELKWTNIQSPGPRVLWDKKWFIEYDLKLEITDFPVTSTCLTPFQGSDSCIGLRPYPLNFAAETILVNLNNRSITVNTRESLYARMEYWPQCMLKLSNGMCPHRKPNGQTFADMDLRKGNSPFCSMAEFNDQDYPNTTLINIDHITFTPGVVAIGSNFERGGIPRSVKVNQNFTYSKTNEGKYGTKPAGLNGAGEGDWGVYYPKAKTFGALKRYIQAKVVYANKIKAYNADKAIPMDKWVDVKKECVSDKSVTDIPDPTTDDGTPVTELTNQFIDLDLLSETDQGALLEDYPLFYHYPNERYPIIYWFQNNSRNGASYELVARIREPVIAEPLDFTSSADFGRTMWNITNVELKYTLANNLNSVVMIDDYRLLTSCDPYWLYNFNLQYVQGAENIKLLTDSHIKVSIINRPQLIYNIATPFTPPNCPFVCQHKQFQRYESHLGSHMKLTEKDLRDFYMDPALANAKPITAVSEAYPLQFHPNSIFIWVARHSSERFDEKYKFTCVDSYAKIKNIRICYGNTSNILAQFDDHELFQMSLRNGLQDRSFLDWNATVKSITVPTDLYGNGANLGWTAKRFFDAMDATGNRVSLSTEPAENPAYNRYAGIGSVVRLIPGIDILTGDTSNPLIAGMHAYSQTIKIEVDFVPLNAYEECEYALYTMFEYDGVCTINPNTCDLGMIAIDSWTQLKSTPKARTMRESYAYGAGLGDKVMKGLRLAANVMKNSGIVTRYRGSGYINSVGNLGKSAKMSGGKLISQGDLWRQY